MKRSFIDYFTDELYELNRKMRPDCPLKIKQKVKDYLMECLSCGRAVNILTQICVSRDLEERRRLQDGKLKVLSSERELFSKEIPRIISLFKSRGFKIDWSMTFNYSFLESGKVSQELSREFKQLIMTLGKDLEIVFYDWERDVLGKKSEPNRDVLRDFEKKVDPGAFKIELDRHSTWAREEARLNQSAEELKTDVKYQIACEAEEAVFISKKLFPEGFIIMPLEYPERYDFFRLLVDDFKDNMVCPLKPYPWRYRG